VNQKVALYSLIIGILGTGGVIYNHLAFGGPLRAWGVMMVPVLALILGFLMWMRWDWAPSQRRRARDDRRPDSDQP
jgi:hypothetical protein